MIKSKICWSKANRKKYNSDIIKNKTKKHQIFAIACCYGYTDLVKQLLTDPNLNPGCSYNFPIKIASHNNHIEIVKILLKHPKVDPSSQKNHALEWALFFGHYEVAYFLLQNERVKRKLTFKMK